MLERILAAFYSTKASFLSVIQLARQTGLSPSELEQQIDELRGLGYTIETHPHLGHHLEAAPDRLMPEDLQGRLLAVTENDPASPTIGNRILVFEKTTSTNDAAKRLAAEGQPEGMVVFAESQTAGRGRHHRKWLSPFRKGLWFSVLLRPSLPMKSVSRLTVMAAVAVATSLRQTTGLPLRIKWPNDVLCHRRKLAGILVEAEAQDNLVRHAIIGVGINVNLETTDFDVHLRKTATSLRMEAGRAFHRPTLAADILLEMNRFQDLLGAEKFSSLLDIWVELDDTLGQQVRVREHDRELRGQAVALDSDGALLIRTDDGKTESVQAGEVEFELAS